MAMRRRTRAGTRRSPHVSSRRLVHHAGSRKIGRRLQAGCEQWGSRMIDGGGRLRGGAVAA
eukprot:256777-Alexandrium_andersonii.AAC.1